MKIYFFFFFFFSSRRRHTRYWRDWSSDVCSSDLGGEVYGRELSLASEYLAAGARTHVHSAASKPPTAPARLASSVRERTPSLRYTAARWPSTVRTLVNSAAATSRLARPAATRSATCRSDAVSAPRVRVRCARSSSAWASRTNGTAPSSVKHLSASCSARRAAALCLRARSTWPSASRLRPSSSGIGERSWQDTARR